MALCHKLLKIEVVIIYTKKNHDFGQQTFGWLQMKTDEVADEELGCKAMKTNLVGLDRQYT